MTEPFPDEGLPGSVRIYIANVNIIGGDTTVLGSAADLDRLGANDLLPALQQGPWAQAREYGPIRRHLVRTSEERMLLRYARIYLKTYRELLARHVPVLFKPKFAFQDDAGYGLRVVYSRVHGAAVILDAGHANRFSSAMIDIPIEHYIWPRTATPWTGKKTTFHSKAHQFTIFIPGKGLFAAGGLTIIHDGTLIYEGRMVLKGDRSLEHWSPAAASFDALHTFMRVAHKLTSEQVVLKKIMGQGDLEVRARAAALARASGGADQITGDPWAHYGEYFARADELGVNPLVATQRLKDIIEETNAASPEDQFRDLWVRPVAQNVIGGVLVLGLGAIAALVYDSGWVGLGVAIVAALFLRLIRHRLRKSRP